MDTSPIQDNYISWPFGESSLGKVTAIALPILLGGATFIILNRRGISRSYRFSLGVGALTLLIEGVAATRIEKIPASEETGLSPFEQLPKENFVEIFRYLNLDDLKSVRLTSKRLKDVIKITTKKNLADHLVAFASMIKELKYLPQDKEVCDIITSIKESVVCNDGKVDELIGVIIGSISKEKGEEEYILEFLYQFTELMGDENRRRHLDCISKLDDSDILSIIERMLKDKDNLSEAEKLAELIANYPEKNKAIEVVATALAKAGEFDRAIELAKLNKSSLGKSITFEAIAKELLKAGELDRAIELAESITWDDHRNRTRTAIVKELLKTGEFDRAIKLAESITDDAYKTPVLKAIATELAKNGNVGGALEIVKDRIDVANIKELSDIFSESTQVYKRLYVGLES